MLLIPQMYAFSNNEPRNRQNEYESYQETYNHHQIPNTPEIVQSLMTITGPFENYVKQKATDSRSFHQNVFENDTSDNICSNPSGTLGVHIGSLKSQLIKEGLKLTIQRRNSGTLTSGILNTSSIGGFYGKCNESNENSVSSVGTEEDDNNSVYERASSSKDTIIPEDEERRKRRRERNKIAATKCRIKKRKYAENLEDESEGLECQNTKLMSKIQELEKQRKQLSELLNVHKFTCLNPSPEPSPLSHSQQPPYFLPTNETHFYNIPL